MDSLWPTGLGGSRMAKKQDDDVLMKAYQKVGLDAAFSKAIVAGGNAKDIIDTWKSDWRGEHGAEHPAIKAVLEGNATPAEAKSLLQAAENHRDLVEAVASGVRSMKWAHIVLSSGFEGNSDAVSALLDGADPTIIAHLLDIKLSAEDAKKIGQKQFGKEEENVAVDITKMSLIELKRECDLARIKKTGTAEELRSQLKTYKNNLKHVVKGYTTGQYPRIKGQMATGYSTNGRTQTTQYGTQYWVTNPRGMTLWFNQKQFDSIMKRRLAPGKPSKDTNKLAASYLQMKSTNYSLQNFKTLILEQARRHGIINESEFQDAIEGKSDFNKA